VGWGHLARRFFGSLWPSGPPAPEGAWAESQMSDREVQLWRRMSGPDRRHAVGVAREVERVLGDEATRPILVAALLHDVGKIESGLGTFGRVVATLAGKAAGREMAREWQRGKGFTRRTGLYLRHDALGADLLTMAGSDPLVIAWAGQHHRDRSDWTVDQPTADVLKAADGD